MAAHSQTNATARKPEVVQFTITGVKSFEKDDLLRNLAIEPSHCRNAALIPVCWISKSPAIYQRAYLDRKDLARDVIRARVFYYQRGYRETTIDTVVQSTGKNTVQITFAVHEGAPTLIANVQVIQKTPVLKQRDIRSMTVVHKGEPLNVFKLDSTRNQLRNQLWQQGFSDAVVDTATAIDTTTRQAVITITITPRWIARVGTIEVNGNEHVTTGTIMKSLPFRPGDVYRRSDVLESQRKLYTSNLFRRASIQVPTRRDSVRQDSVGQGLVRRDSVRRDSVKHVVVTVQEAPPRAVRLSGGFNTADFVQVEGRYSDYNWYGGARQLNIAITGSNLLARQLNGTGIFYDVSKTTVGAGEGKYFLPALDVSGELRQPWFRSPNNDIAASLFSHRRVAPGIYVDRGYGTALTFTRLIGTGAHASLSYRFEVTNVDAGDVYFCVSSGVCDSPTLTALRKNQKLSPLALTLSTDRADDPYEPRRGYRGELDEEYASGLTLSAFRYNRISNEESVYLPVGRRSVLAGHLRLGYVNALASTAQAVGADRDSLGTDRILHPRKRLYLGGARSVRGFGENQLGPHVLTVAPEVLRRTATDSTACLPSTPITQCNPNAAHIRAENFSPRPIGGNELIEGSVEYRFPVLGSFLGAIFVDAGYLAQSTNPTLAHSAAAITPGLGVRYLSPAGPIRVDVAFNPSPSETLPVVTEDIQNGHATLVTLEQRRKYSVGSGLWSRLTLHLAIGEAY